MAIELLNIDCMDYMKSCTDKQFDLAIVDPPYGINAANMTMGSNPNRSGIDARGEIQYGNVSVAQKIKKGRLNSGGGHFAGKNLTTMNCDWDFYKPDIEYFTEVQRVSKNQIIWGGNYFTDKVPVSRCWICWDKKQPWDNFSQFELAWTSFDSPAKLFTNSNRGGRNDEMKIHPTQKPIYLYNYCLKHFAKEGFKILDTHLGSGSSAIAAHYFNCDFVGCEIDQKYFDSMMNRFKIKTAQNTFDFGTK